jgi:hypothetical protein
MARRFALDQNFPEPIVDGLVDWLASDAELMPIRRIDQRMAMLDDWEVLQALHADRAGWDGLITTDAKMLSLPRELAVLCQTNLPSWLPRRSDTTPSRPRASSSLTSVVSVSRLAQIQLRCGACARARSPLRIHGTSSPGSPSGEAPRLTSCTRASG